MDGFRSIITNVDKNQLKVAADKWNAIQSQCSHYISDPALCHDIATNLYLRELCDKNHIRWDSKKVSFWIFLTTDIKEIVLTKWGNSQSESPLEYLEINI